MDLKVHFLILARGAAFGPTQIRLRRICGPFARASSSCVDGPKAGLRVVLAGFGLEISHFKVKFQGSEQVRPLTFWG